MSNQEFCSIEHTENPPKQAEVPVSDDLRRALDLMAAFSRNPSLGHEVKKTGSYTVVKPLREAY
jgi:hypothetical protein